MDLQTAIDELYRVFQPYRIGPDFSGCDHCVDPRQSALLAQMLLRSLTWQDLESYASKAMTTWGETRHFKHFLPRLFELVAQHDDDCLWLEVLFGKLPYGNWGSWPRVERRSIEQFLMAFWTATLAAELGCEEDHRVDRVLCALGNACDTVQPFLDAWLKVDGKAPIQQLGALILLNHADIKRRNTLSNAFWKERAQQAREVVTWLKSAAVHEHLFDGQQQLADWQGNAVPVLADMQVRR